MDRSFPGILRVRRKENLRCMAEAKSGAAMRSRPAFGGMNTFCNSEWSIRP